MRKRATREPEMGQTAVEFALTVPVIILVIFGIFDFGRAVWYYNTLSEAAREGTRYAMVHGATSSSPVGPGASSYTAPNRDTIVEGVVERYAFGMDVSQVTVLSTWPDGGNKSGQRVNVEVQYTYAPLTGVILGGISIPLRSVAVASIVY